MQEVKEIIEKFLKETELLQIDKSEIVCNEDYMACYLNNPTVELEKQDKKFQTVLSLRLLENDVYKMITMHVFGIDLPSESPKWDIVLLDMPFKTSSTSRIVHSIEKDEKTDQEYRKVIIENIFQYTGDFNFDHFLLNLKDLIGLNNILINYFYQDKISHLVNANDGVLDEDAANLLLEKANERAKLWLHSDDNKTSKDKIKEPEDTI